jgi:polysaccharide biosynthesis protein PslG
VLWKAAQTGYSGPAFIFSIRVGNSPQRTNRDDNFGALLTSDWQPKVAAGVLAR